MFSDLHNRSGFGFRGNATINSTPITFPSTKRPRERLQISLKHQRLATSQMNSVVRVLGNNLKPHLQTNDTQTHNMYHIEK